MLPFILIGVAISSAAFGAEKGYSGVAKKKEADNIRKKAEERHKMAMENLETYRSSVNMRAEEYGTYLLKIKEDTFAPAIKVIEAIGGRHGQKIYQILSDIGISNAEIKEYKDNIEHIRGFVKGVGIAVGAGLAASQVATLGSVLFGTASTGATIGSLSGVAASNATLAFFGGGSLASGGGGMALGSLVLGGVAVGPAILVAGYMVNVQGEKALTNAKAFEATADEKIGDIRLRKDFLYKVICQIAERDDLMRKLNRRAQQIISAIDVLSFDKDKESDVETLQSLLLFIKAMSELMQSPILSKDGRELDGHDLKICAKYRELV